MVSEEPSEEFWTKFEVYAGPMEPSARQWLTQQMREIGTPGKVDRMAKSIAIKEVASAQTAPTARGRPRRRMPKLPPRAQWAMQRAVAAGEDPLGTAATEIAAEPPSPPRMDWQRYFLISVLAAAWGRRLNRAKGIALGFSRRADQTPTGPFFEAVKLCLHHMGRADSDAAIADAIETARSRIYAL